MAIGKSIFEKSRKVSLREFDRPTGVAVDKDGTIYVADYKNDRLQVFSADGSFVTQLTGEATLSKWGAERVNIDPNYVRGREIAQGLEEREKVFQGPIAVDVDVRLDQIRQARLKGYEGDNCGDCGNFTLVRNGTCLKCVTCGATSGCS